MDYTDNSRLLLGLRKFPGTNFDGCLSIYNRYYDAYLDRARLIYGDTDVTDVTPASVNSTLRSRYIAAVEQLYQGRDQFEKTYPVVVDLGISYHAIPVFLAIAPMGPRDLSCIIYGCTGDGMNVDCEEITNGRCIVLTLVILSDCVWGHTFEGKAKSHEDGVECTHFVSRVARQPSFNSGYTQHACAFFPVVYWENTFSRLPEIDWHVMMRDTTGSEERRIAFVGDVKSVYPTMGSSARRFTFYQFDKKVYTFHNNVDDSGFIDYGAISDLCTKTRYGYESAAVDYSPRGNFEYASVSPANKYMFHTTKDRLSLISAALLSAGI